MVALTPIPFSVLVTRLFQELERKQTAFDLPARRFFAADPERDYAVSIFGHRASTPFGPAAGPHTQLAQNIVLSWLAGGRMIELKTVQILDELDIPRPCIDMATIGFNIEWSQELSLEQSLEEYVKASMLIEMLKASGMAAGHDETVFDMSLGYDLAGIRSDRMQAFIRGMQDASPVIERLRAQIPEAWAHLRDLPFPTRLSDTVTLSTFHGCPPDEIEKIAAYLMREVGLHVVVKLNPTLLGQEELTAILRDRLGYDELEVPDSAFEKDAKWPDVQAFVGRLGSLAESLGRGVGVKFSNTLIVRNHKSFFPSTEKEMYMSGAPLHVLAMALVRRFRRAFGDRFPVSFSAGIDGGNFAEAVALGLKPVTVCSDMLKTAGYGRTYRYFGGLARRMQAVGATDIDTFTLKAFGQAEAALSGLDLPEARAEACRAALASGADLRAAAGDAFEGWVSAARLLNTEVYAEQLLDDPRYSAQSTDKPPKKIGSHLELFNCVTCDKCIPVCPNDANFSFVIPPGEVPVERLVGAAGEWAVEPAGVLSFTKSRQIGTFADACNDCGNCDVACPEDGGPYAVKPNFFSSVAAWEAAPGRDGFVLERANGGIRVHGRFDGRTVTLDDIGDRVRYRGDGFDLTLDPADPAGTAEGTADGAVDLTWLRIMTLVRKAMTAEDALNYVSVSLRDGGNGDISGLRG